MAELTDKQVRQKTAELILEGKTIASAEGLSDEMRNRIKVLMARALGLDSCGELRSEIIREQTDGLLLILRLRLDRADKKLRDAIDFDEVEKSLRANPEKLFALKMLERTGGEPQLVGIKGDEFIFEDRSPKSPIGRRDLNFEQAAARAEDFGVDMQSPDAYKAMQKTGQFDQITTSWLATDEKTRAAGHAYYGLGYYHGGGFNVHLSDAENHKSDWGWRASLRVPRK